MFKWNFIEKSIANEIRWFLEQHFLYVSHHL